MKPQMYSIQNDGFYGLFFQAGEEARAEERSLTVKGTLARKETTAEKEAAA